MGIRASTDNAPRAATLELLKAHLHIIALFRCNDTIAIDAMHVARWLGYRVPEDISVVGFDGIGLGANIEPPLTTLYIDKVGMGRTAVELLKNRAQNPEAERVTALVQPRLIERETAVTKGADKFTCQL